MKLSPRTGLVDQIQDTLAQAQVVVLVGERGRGQTATVDAVAPPSGSWVLSCSGNWLTGGYLAGFHELIEAGLAWCSANAPAIISHHEQSLKRLLPLYDCPHFLVPKDLTNTSSKEERTRFYHSEYQNKLLVGTWEFLRDYLTACRRPCLLKIDDASAMSPTAVSLLGIILRSSVSADLLKFVLIDYDGSLGLVDAPTITCPTYDSQELLALLALDSAMSREKAEAIVSASGGNAAAAEAVLTCVRTSVPVVGYLDPRTMIDLYLGTLDRGTREGMAARFIADGCRTDNVIDRRNYETLDDDFVDREHLTHHRGRMAAYGRGEAPLITIHARSIRNKFRRLSALVAPTEILKNIGLYDTLFSYFGQMFTDPELRSYGSGDDPENALFINAAFILYALGCGQVSAPYLEEFQRAYPRSKFLPTVLYAQSMTYGRYLLPVNLPLAEQYALANIDTIEAHFRQYDKYDYISVFAENAYAYIKAKQGKFNEALALCSNGNERMLRVYGPDRFRLHQSILIYNTSQVYELVKDYRKAEAQLRLAMAYDPYYGEYHNDLGNLLAKVPGREGDALAAYATAIGLCPPYHEAYLNRGILYVALGDQDAAMNDFRRALEIKPDDWRVLFEIGNLHMARSEHAAALHEYRHAERVDGASADLQCNIGLACSELGDPVASVRHYRAAIALNPRNATAHNNLALELFQQGVQQDALKHATIAAELSDDPDYESNRLLLASSLAQAAG